MGYVGSAPAGVQLTGSDAVFVFTASGGETSVTTADSGASVVYEPGFVSVFVNGVRFVEGDDYTASTGSGVLLTSALNGGDVVVVVASDTRALDDAVPRSGGSFAGGVDFLGGLDSTTVTASGDVSANTATIAGDVTSNGETVFHRGNVVGTVSQSGGTPTGAVVERDSNGNGEYVRYADGTLICHKLHTFTDNTYDQFIPYPSPFAATPAAGFSREYDGNVNEESDIRFFEVYPAAGGWVFSLDVTTPGYLNGSLIAIGRWY